MKRLDAVSGDQALWIGVVSDAISLKLMLENQLKEAQINNFKKTNKLWS